MHIFVSYPFKSDLTQISAEIVDQVKNKTRWEVDFWDKSARPGNFNEILKKQIIACDFIVTFLGSFIGDTQLKEIECAVDFKKEIIPIRSPDYNCPKALEENHDTLGKLEHKTSIRLGSNFKTKLSYEAGKATSELIKLINNHINHHFLTKGLPVGYPFQYEKDIISAYLSGGGSMSDKLVEEGCPPTWPQIKKKTGSIDNPLKPKTVGNYRDWDETTKTIKDPQVISAALSDYHCKNTGNCMLGLHLSFPEAGPRKWLYHPHTDREQERDRFRVGIVVSGGIAPGINSVISGIVKRHIAYHEASRVKRAPMKIYGYLEGFRSLFNSYRGPRTKILYDSTSKESKENWLKSSIFEHSTQGGSIVPTSRTGSLMEDDGKCFKDIIRYLEGRHLDIVYVIGGDGSMKGAHVLSNYIEKEGLDVSVVGIPKTMDNDILWVWQSFGFASSIEWAKGATKQLHTEVSSNPRLCIVQLFGSDSGFVASHTALASGVCDLALIPEVEFKSTVVVDYIMDKLEERYEVTDDKGRSPYGIILLAETALPNDALDDDILNASGLGEKEKEEVKRHFANKCRVKGQTTDELRSAGLKILESSIKKALSRKNKYWQNFRVLTIEPKQLIRSVPPSTLDIILGGRLGSLAVDGAMAGYHDFMISQWLTEFVMVPLELVVLGRKRIPHHGFLWKSVISTTGQPDDLTAPYKARKKRNR